MNREVEMSGLKNRGAVMGHNPFYRQALREWDDCKIDGMLGAKAAGLAMGDPKKLRSAYLTLRADALQKEVFRR